MSNNLRLEALLKAVNQATRPLKSIQAESKTLSGNIRDTQNKLRDLNDQAAKIEGFRKTSRQLAVTGQALNKAKRETSELAVKLKNTINPTHAQIQEFEAAKRSAAELQTKYNSLSVSVQRQRSELMQAGINTRTLSADKQRLKTSIGETTGQLNRQREALSRVNAQQAKLSRIKSRYQSGKKLAGNVAAVGTAGMEVSSKLYEGVSHLVAPGIAFDKQMSNTQAILGLNKDDEKMAQIRNQARDAGGTSFSPGDVTRTQTILARSGYKADDILAATSPTINLSVAADIDIAQAADIITNMQSAFNLPITEIQRVADVMTKGFTSAQTGLVEFSEAMKNVAPVAEMAGASIEDTSAILGILADNGIKGSVAGTEASTIFSRLQAPTGEAADVIARLGVTTHDTKGNMLPIEQILKAISLSFAKNNLGSAEQHEALNVIFGDEAMTGADKLVTAAGDGSLDKKRNEMQNATGSTELVAKIQTDNLDGDLKKLQSAWEGMQIDVLEKEDSVLRKLITSATAWLGTVGEWIKANPTLTSTILTVITGAMAFIGIISNIAMVLAPVITGINAIIAAAGFLGPLFTTVGSAIMTALGAITWPIVAIVAAIVAGVILIRKYWEPISAFFSGVIEGIMDAFAPIGEIFAPLAPVFEYLGEKLSSLWQWFKDLIAPVQSTQETLDSCKNAGVIFGQVLASAFMAPLTVFNKLRSGASWLLEKLGIINKESDSLDKTADKIDAAILDNSNTLAISANSSYQPLTTPAGRSYVDQSKSEYNITLQGGAVPGHELDRQLRDTVEQIEREKRARQRASMSYD